MKQSLPTPVTSPCTASSGVPEPSIGLYAEEKTIQPAAAQYLSSSSFVDECWRARAGT